MRVRFQSKPPFKPLIRSSLADWDPTERRAVSTRNREQVAPDSTICPCHVPPPCPVSDPGTSTRVVSIRDRIFSVSDLRDWCDGPAQATMA
jgi:hypothetical protein